MARTVTQAFRELKGNLEITDLQESTASTRQQNVRRAVESYLTVLDSFLTGSYSRHTMIAPLKEADLDIFVVLDPGYYEEDGQANLLDRVERVLKNTYPRTPDISRNGQAVTIQFTDFAVDVVPAFYRKGGGYLIPNSARQTWIATDPKKHVEILSDANARHNGNLVPLIKMVKGWNRNIERHFPDPSGYGGDVGAYLNTNPKIENAVARFESACDRAIRAEDYNRRGYVAEAIDMWRIIFGQYFPAYG